jgi:uncharacterized membrane protein
MIILVFFVAAVFKRIVVSVGVKKHIAVVVVVLDVVVITLQISQLLRGYTESAHPRLISVA